MHLPKNEKAKPKQIEVQSSLTTLGLIVVMVITTSATR